MTTVVLGYVPKPEGEAALTASIAEAQLRHADLVVVNSHRPRHNDAVAAIESELAEVRSRVEAAGVAVDIRHPDTGFEASEDLLAVADEVAAELIIIGLRRRTPVGKLILGSNAQRILLDSQCPVLAVKSD